jgi:hypothetical protein
VLPTSRESGGLDRLQTSEGARQGACSDGGEDKGGSSLFGNIFVMEDFYFMIGFDGS